MERIPVSPKLTLVFGLDWAQHDQLETKLHKQIGMWKDEGYKFAAQYEHAGGRVFGRYRPTNDQVKFDSTCISGAAVIATHPSLVDKTAVVLIEFQDPEGDHKVIFVGVRDGLVLMDDIINASDISAWRNNFRTLYSPNKEVFNFGEFSGLDQRIDHPYTFAQLTPGKGGGKACHVTELRSSYLNAFAWIGLALAVVAVIGYYAWQIHLDSAAELKKRMAMKENTPEVIYAKEVARWFARPVNFVAPSVDFMHEQLRTFPIALGGWILVNVSCLNEQCTSRWHRDVGTLDEFRAAAPEGWKTIIAAGQEDIDVVLDFKLPTAKIDPTTWPKFPPLKDKLLSHWQYLNAAGWHADLGEVKQLAIPPGFSVDQTRAVANVPNAPHGVDVKAENQQWWFADPDPKAPLRAENLTEQVELVSPLMVKYDGKHFTFNFTGIIYVSTN